MLRSQSHQPPTPRSRILHQTTSTCARMADNRTLPLPLSPNAVPRARMDADPICSGSTAPSNSALPSQIQHPQVSEFSKAGPGPSKTVATLNVPSSLLADPCASGFARRFGSLARRRRTCSFTVTSPDRPGTLTLAGPRMDSVADEALSDGDAVGSGGR